MYLGQTLLLIVGMNSGFAGEVIQLIQSYQLLIKNNEPLQSWGLMTERQTQAIGKMIAKYLIVKEKKHNPCMQQLQLVQETHYQVLFSILTGSLKKP